MFMTQMNKKRGFTLVEIMIVVAIIGLLAAVAIPNFVKARQTAQRNACIKNLQQIDGSKETWALEKKKGPGDPIVEDEVNAYIKGGAPKCPAGGTYTYGAVGTDPTCTVATHVLPASAAAPAAASAGN
jgi:prepilin-type N-terminal cleavage/methylation domain-containing protein